MEQYAQINRMFWNGSYFQYIFYASIALILVLEKRKLHKIVFGVFPVVMIFGMFNPATSVVIFKVFHSSNLYYVRLFSIIPVFYCMAHGAMLLLDKAQGIVKLCGACIAIALFVFAGHSVYQEDWMQRAENPQKVPDEVFEVLDVIPREKENVRVAFPEPLYLYARQVDGSIIMPYGRQLSGSPIQFLDELNAPVPNVSTVMTLAGNQSVDYIVVKKSEEAKAVFFNSGYAPVGETEGYCVYPVTGVPKIELTLNEKRQVESSTYVDPDGNPAYSNLSVITTRVFEYDRWGNKTKETFFDKDGRRVTTIEGFSSTGRSYKLYGLTWIVDSITHMDNSDQPVLVAGRYETRFKHLRKRNSVEERYYDQDGQPMDRLDTGYAATLLEYDANGRLISEKFTDTLGNPVSSTDGYAGYTLEYNDFNRITTEKYYNTEGMICNNSAGFAEWNRTYDDSGNVIEESFIDEQGKTVDMKSRIRENPSFDLLQLAKKESVANSVGIGYAWNEDGSCTVTGEAQGISWNNIIMDNRPFYFINGETYRVEYSSENVHLRICFYEDSTWNKQVDVLIALDDAEFTVPQNCGAVIIRLWVAPGTNVNETVHPKIYAEET